MGFYMANSVNNTIDKPYPCTRDTFFATASSLAVAKAVAEVRDIQARMDKCEKESDVYKMLKDQKCKAKKLLPIFLFHAEYEPAERTNECAKSSGLAIIDVDHIKKIAEELVKEGTLAEIPDFNSVNPAEWLYNYRLKGKEDEHKVALVTASCSGDGLRVVFVIPEGETVPSAQEWFSNRFELPHDVGVKDLARASYSMTKEDILFIDEKRLFYTPMPPDDAPVNQYNRGLITTSKSKIKAKATVPASALNVSYNPGLKIDGIEIKDLLPSYWKFLQAKGIIKGTEPTEGERHLALMTFAQNFAPFLNCDPTLLRAAMPPIMDAEDQSEVDAIVRDKIEYLVSNGLTKRNAEIVALVNKTRSELIMKLAYPSVEECIDFESGLPKLPKCMEQALKILASGYRFPAIVVMNAVAMCLADEVTVAKGMFEPDRLRALTHVDSLSGVGKSLIYKPSQSMMKTFIERSERAEEERRKWLKSSSASSGKKDKKKEKTDSNEADILFPDLRLMPQATSDNAQLEISRHGRTLLTFETELEGLVRQFKKSSYDRAPRLIPAFDGSRHGNMTCVGGSVNGSAITNWVVVTSGTRSALHSLVKWHGNETDGLPNRLAIAVLPRQKGTLVAKYSERDREELRHLGEVLMRMKGYLSSPRLSKALEEWEKPFAIETSDVNESVKRSLAGRVAFIAFRFASAMQLFYIADKVIAQEKRGERSTDETIDVSDFAEPKAIAEWGTIFADYFLDKQWSIFGANMVKRIRESFSSVILTQRRSDEWLDRVPDTFTYSDVCNALGAASVTSTLRMKVKRARERGRIKVVDEGATPVMFEKIG